MKKANIYVLALLLAFLPAGCAHELEESAPAVPQVFTGVIEQGVVTKTELAPLEEGVHKVKWSVGDEVLIGGVIFRVETTSSDGLTATFKAVDDNAVPLRQVYPNSSGTLLYSKSGSAGDNAYYAAWYPPAILDQSSSHWFTLPNTQYYKEGRIDNLPMYAISRTGESFLFRNLCAVLAISLTGSSDKKVGKIRLQHGTRISGISYFNNGANAGYFNHHLTNPSFTLYSRSNNGDYYVVLDCLANTSNAGVTLDPTTPKTFYIAVPPIKYYQTSLTITVIAPNGTELQTFPAKKEVTAERAHIYPISLTLN